MAQGDGATDAEYAEAGMFLRRLLAEAYGEARTGQTELMRLIWPDRRTEPATSSLLRWLNGNGPCKRYLPSIEAALARSGRFDHLERGAKTAINAYTGSVGIKVRQVP